eukprot:352308-Karenia_brevis.AAC.1
MEVQQELPKEVEENESYMASRDEEETACMDGVTEFHFTGTDDAPVDKKLKFGEHRGKMFSE